MKCKRCNAEMKIGKAIKSNLDERAIYITAPVRLNADTLKIIDVLKCPQCGHSDYI